MVLLSCCQISIAIRITIQANKTIYNIALMFNFYITKIKLYTTVLLKQNQRKFKMSNHILYFNYYFFMWTKLINFSIIWLVIMAEDASRAGQSIIIKNY